MSIRTIVVAHDGSDGAARALEWATGLAQQTDARLVAVHAWSPLDDLGRHRDRADFAELHAEALADLEAWVAPARTAGIAVEARIVEDLPVPGVVQVAREVDADLVVCGTRGRGRVRAAVLGSVARTLPEASHLPVTVVPPA
jgi:nucleotide-binding universal stress UspA family protein